MPSQYRTILLTGILTALMCIVSACSAGDWPSAQEPSDAGSPSDAGLEQVFSSIRWYCVEECDLAFALAKSTKLELEPRDDGGFFRLFQGQQYRTGGHLVPIEDRPGCYRLRWWAEQVPWAEGCVVGDKFSGSVQLKDTYVQRVTVWSIEAQ